MANITTFAGKGDILTKAEMDANFLNLNSELANKPLIAAVAAAPGDILFTFSTPSSDWVLCDGSTYTGGGALAGLLPDGKLPDFTSSQIPAYINKNIVGDTNTYVDGSDPRLSDSREWTAATVDQVEAEAGAATTRRAWTAERVRQAVLGWWGGFGAKTTPADADALLIADSAASNVPKKLTWANAVAKLRGTFVEGPASSVDGQVMVFDGASGKKAKATASTITFDTGGGKAVVYGSELVVNAITLGNGWTESAGVYTFQCNTASPGALETTVNVTSGKMYELTWGQANSAENNVILTPTVGPFLGIACSVSVDEYKQLIAINATGALTLKLTPTESTTGTATVTALSLVEITPTSVDFNYKGTETISGVVRGTANFIIGGGGTFVTTGSDNNASGDYALYSNTAGNGNNANGYAALASNTTGSDNNANGNAALAFNTTGSHNNANGNAALYSNTTGSDNNASGDYALYSNTAGSHNNANGKYALYSNTTGSHNNANGYDAGSYYNDGADEELTVANNCIFMGRSTRASKNNALNQIVIGDSAIGVGDNTAVVGGASLTLLATPGAIQSVGKTVATLGTAPEGSIRYATNGCKVGEAPGAGTGVPVYYSNGQWRTFSNDATVTA